MPFSAALSDDSYYGIAMAHSEQSFGSKPSKIVGSYGGGYVNTFGSYIEEEGLEVVYNNLLQKYNGDANKITVDEMYDGLIKQHKKYMLGDSESPIDIPLWMNRRNYTDFIGTI